MAQALVELGPGDWTGCLAIDVGAGTGLASQVLVGRGASVIAVDLAHAMLARDRRGRPPSVVGDAAALPLREGVADVAVLAFCLNHAPEPEAMLAELRRVLRPGGAVLSSTFAGDRSEPVKERVDATLVSFGFTPPPWRARMAGTGEERCGDPDELARMAAAAGLVEVAVERIDVVVDRLDAGALVDWRLGMAHCAEWVDGLDGARRGKVRAAACDAVADLADHPVVVPMLALAARAR